VSIRLGLVVGLLFAILVTYLASINPGRAHLALGGDWAVDVPLMGLVVGVFGVGAVLALQKISEGGFGDCERCGEPISEKRLEALPFARYCIECQRAVEEEERTAAR